VSDQNPTLAKIARMGHPALLNSGHFALRLFIEVQNKVSPGGILNKRGVNAGTIERV
jgi:hypothetical protein